MSDFKNQNLLSPFAGGMNVRNNSCKSLTWAQIEAMMNSDEHRNRCFELLKGNKAVKISSPYITAHAADFTDGKRNNKSAVANNCVMLDADHQDPDTIWGRLKSKDDYKTLLKEQGIILASKSVSAQGFRAIARLAIGETIEEGIARLASFFGVEADTVCKDLARASFLPIREYVYYLDKEAKNPTAPLLSPHEGGKTNEKSLSPFMGESEGATLYSDAVNRWLAQNGGEPTVGNRNNTLYRMALDFRYICDFNEAWLARELPSFSLGDDEVRSVIHSAVKQDRLQNIPKRLLAAIDKKVSDAMQNEENISKENYLYDIRHRELPKLPTLPPSLEALLEGVPEDFRPAVFIALLPALGTLATGLRFRYLDGQMHSASFLSTVIGQSGSGKSFVRFPLDLMLTPIHEEDDAAREIENEYKKACKRAKNSKEQPEDPQVCVRCHPLNITKANMVRHMLNAKGKHLFAFGEEIDTLYQAEKQAYSQKKDIFRYAYDNGKYGVSNATENSLNIYQEVYFNLLVCGTPAKTLRYFDNVEDGLVARTCFAQMPNTFASDIPVYHEYDAATRAYVVNVMRQLMNRSGEYTDEAVVEATKAWNAKAQSWARLTGSWAVDHYRRRACSMGFRAGMLISVLEQIEAPNAECRKPNGEKIVEWVADYCFTMFMRLFGDKYEDQAREDNNANEGLFTSKLFSSKGSPSHLLADLDNEFTLSDIIALRIANGKSTKDTAIKKIIYRWKKDGKIQEVEKNKYKKVS